MLSILFSLIIAAIAAEELTEIAVKDKITASAREWLQKKSKFLNGLFSCGRCFSFWAAISFFWVTSHGYGWILYPFVVHRIANVIHNTNDALRVRHRQLNYMLEKEIIAQQAYQTRLQGGLNEQSQDSKGAQKTP